MKLIIAVLVAGCAFAQRSVLIEWTPDPRNPAGTTHNVYRASAACDASAPVFAKINTAPVTDRTYIDAGVAIGQTYCYRVTAEFNKIESIPSNTAAAVVAPYPPGTATITVQVTVTVDSPKP